MCAFLRAFLCAFVCTFLCALLWAFLWVFLCAFFCVVCGGCKYVSGSSHEENNSSLGPELVHVVYLLLFAQALYSSQYTGNFAGVIGTPGCL